MMSFISVYFNDVLNFPKESIGVIKGVIQPLLYFLPIVSGALADRFGYRRLLMAAFSLLGCGYFLTSQTTAYGAVFASLVIMGFGAGIFKPLISGTIAKITDDSNSSLGFGIYYWSINVGAFLFPLILVPFLKAINPAYVIIASALCTAVMLIPTALLFKDPVQAEKMEKRQKTGLLQTIANAFEIIYSPVVLIAHQIKKSWFWKIVLGVFFIACLTYAMIQYFSPVSPVGTYSKIGITSGGPPLLFKVDRNMLGKPDYLFSEFTGTDPALVTVYKPDYLNRFADTLIREISRNAGFENTTLDELKEWMALSDQKVRLEFRREALEEPFRILKRNDMSYILSVSKGLSLSGQLEPMLEALHAHPILAGVTAKDLADLHEKSRSRPFFLLFVLGLALIGMVIITTRNAQKAGEKKKTSPAFIIFILALGAAIWALPGLSVLGRIIASVIYLTITSLFIIDSSDRDRFRDHAKFLLMIFLYSGFWVLYFQMFDSVLWYVKAYVDATSLNAAVNGFLGKMGLQTDWFFDVEHVTVINAGTIILLQLLVSRIVRKTKALPTMMAGIGLATAGMAILALSPRIWVFIAGIMIFSIGEMTAHPKFISYIGLTYKKAMYMGYLFLYGVFGSSIGGIVGARLYVRFVDDLHRPRTLWLIFSSIGLATIIALALYNRFLKPREASGKN